MRPLGAGIGIIDGGEFVNVICCQTDIVWENKSANHDRVRALLQASTVPAGSLVLLPEMFATGFSMNVSATRDDADHLSETFLARLAVDFKAYVAAGVVSRASDGRGRNEALVFNPAGGLIARYCKLHPFSFAGEHQRFAPGGQVTVWPCGEFAAAPFVCYDLRFPEAFRQAVRKGAQLFTVLANWPASREAHWVALLRARAIENQAYVAGVNRCGRDPNVSYSGRSLVFDPRGEILADAGNAECVIQASLELEKLSAYRREFPFLNDMRGDLFA
jgi:predicted amidohydrolase